MTIDAISNDKGLFIPPAALESFSEDVGLLWRGPIVPTLQRPPTSLEFSRDYVAKNRPCIIRNAMIDQGGIPLHLTLDDITEKINPQTKITVDCTPDGHGDVVRAVRLADGSIQQTFVQPHEQEMTLEEFHKKLRSQPGSSSVNGPADNFGRKILSPASQEEKVSGSASSLPDNTRLYYSRQVGGYLLVTRNTQYHPRRFLLTTSPIRMIVFERNLRLFRRCFRQRLTGQKQLLETVHPRPLICGLAIKRQSLRK
jgi:hypothetical protein